MKKHRRKLLNERGIALVLVLILAAISLAMMAALVYMITASTQISGLQKRYKTAIEAGKGGAEVTFAVIAARGNPNFTGITINPTASQSQSGAVPSTCPEANLVSTYTSTNPIDCLSAKLNYQTKCWPTVCNASIDIDPSTASTNHSYDMTFQLGTTATYNVFSKIVDTVEGNSGSNTGLIKSGVVSSNSGEVPVQSRPYLYTMEVHAVNANNSAEKASYSILYEY